MSPVFAKLMNDFKSKILKKNLENKIVKNQLAFILVNQINLICKYLMYIKSHTQMHT